MMNQSMALRLVNMCGLRALYDLKYSLYDNHRAVKRIKIGGGSQRARRSVSGRTRYVTPIEKRAPPNVSSQNPIGDALKRGVELIQNMDGDKEDTQSTTPLISSQETLDSQPSVASVSSSDSKKSGNRKHGLHRYFESVGPVVPKVSTKSKRSISEIAVQTDSRRLSNDNDSESDAESEYQPPPPKRLKVVHRKKRISAPIKKRTPVPTVYMMEILRDRRKRYLNVYRNRLQRIYEEHRPENVSKVDEWMKTFGPDLGKLHGLYSRVCEKYGLVPCSKYEGQSEDIAISQEKEKPCSLLLQQQVVSSQDNASDPVIPVNRNRNIPIAANPNQNRHPLNFVVESDTDTHSVNTNETLPISPRSDQNQITQSLEPTSWTGTSLTAVPENFTFRAGMFDLPSDNNQRGKPAPLPVQATTNNQGPSDLRIFNLGQIQPTSRESSLSVNAGTPRSENTNNSHSSRSVTPNADMWNGASWANIQFNDNQGNQSMNQSNNRNGNIFGGGQPSQSGRDMNRRGGSVESQNFGTFNSENDSSNRFNFQWDQSNNPNMGNADAFSISSAPPSRESSVGQSSESGTASIDWGMEQRRRNKKNRRRRGRNR